MKIQESYVKDLFKIEGINTLRGRLVKNPEEAHKAFVEMNVDECILKANVALKDKFKLKLSEVINENSNIKQVAEEMLKSKLVKSDDYDALNNEKKKEAYKL